jgi:hypothetical protein
MSLEGVGAVRLLGGERRENMRKGGPGDSPAPLGARARYPSCFASAG